MFQFSNLKSQISNLNSQLSILKPMKINVKFWKKVMDVLVAIITAAITALTTTSCMGHGPF